jgi:glucose dehydrogenase
MAPAWKREVESSRGHTNGGGKMSDSNRLLSGALILFGAIFFLIYTWAMFWLAGWAWRDGGPAASDYFLMIVGVYATLGIFLIRAAKGPRSEHVADLVQCVVEHHPCGGHGL